MGALLSVGPWGAGHMQIPYGLDRVHRLESGYQGPPLWGSLSSENALHSFATVLHPPAVSSASPSPTFHTSVL